ncbi:MAG: YceD family protein [Proteobacteria bacterium]|nr:YceD family protein [Pseudomonadota bacterium]
MAQIGDILINSLEFAREMRRLTGSFPVLSLRRLADVLANDNGSLSWVALGECDADHKLFLVIEAVGELQLKCQRCLGALTFGLKIRSRLQLVPEGAAWPDEDLEDDRVDPIEALDNQSLLTLIEDEVLLALPIAPRHPSCQLPGYDDGSSAVSPFATLAKLKKH